MPVKNRDKSIKKRAMKAHRKTNKRQKKHGGFFNPYSYFFGTNSDPSNSAPNDKPSASTSSITFSDYLPSFMKSTPPAEQITPPPQDKVDPTKTIDDESKLTVVNGESKPDGGRKKRHRRTSKTE
jgi:hypothetical protein